MTVGATDDYQTSDWSDDKVWIYSYYKIRRYRS